MEDKIKVYTKIHLFSFLSYIVMWQYWRKRKKIANQEKRSRYLLPPYLLATLELGLENIFHLLIKKF